MDYIRIDITADEPQQERLIATLDEFGATGFEQNEAALIAYFPAEAFAEHEVRPVLQGFQFRVGEEKERNWNAEWERDFQPVVVDDFVAVRAHFHPAAVGVQHDLVITPKMSFGTGHHATTYLMMQGMRDLDFSGKRVFDFGTGTGILAILAEKLGAMSVEAIDVDDWSVTNTAENLDRNGCTKVSVALSSNLPSGPFEVVLANINRHVILRYLPLLPALLAPDATVLLSGLLASDENAVNDAATQTGLRFATKQERQGWISLRYNAPDLQA